MNPDKVSKGWTDIRHQLKSWSKPALLALVKDLYEFSSGNRDFLRARFQAEVAGGAALEQNRGKIIEQLLLSYCDSVRDQVSRLEEALAGGSAPR